MPTGRELVRLAEKHVGERYILGAKVPMSNPKWTGPWDCAEFVSWCVYQVTDTLFGCRPRDGNPDAVEAYTGYWWDDAKKFKASIPVEEAAATLGAVVLRRPGTNGIGHIVISLGDGTTIEAMGANKGVRNGKLDDRRWDIGILVPGIDVKPATSLLAVNSPGVILQVKSPPISGPLVKAVQKSLKALGFSPGPIDGEYGPQTAAAVFAFQVANRLVADAEVGPLTAKALKVDWPLNG